MGKKRLLFFSVLGNVFKLKTFKNKTKWHQQRYLPFGFKLLFFFKKMLRVLYARSIFVYWMGFRFFPSVAWQICCDLNIFLCITTVANSGFCQRPFSSCLNGQVLQHLFITARVRAGVSILENACLILFRILSKIIYCYSYALDNRCCFFGR